MCSLQARIRLGKVIAETVLCCLVVAGAARGQQEQTFKGEISDSLCANKAGHAAMLNPGETNAQCTIACLRMGAKCVLVDSRAGTVYKLDNQRQAKKFAGQQVIVNGMLDRPAQTIHVSRMIRALPAKVTEARSAYIDCDACPRGMAAAGRTAYQELQHWGRFTLTPDRRGAELIFLFSANKYLGDYVTRDGPDLRPVSVDITYMNVIDPKSGESLWGDSRQWGSLLVSRATKDLIEEFREQLEAGDDQTERLLPLMDKDGDRKVSKEEFLKFMESEFDRLDTDKDGYLNVNELRKLRVADAGK